MFRNAVVLPWLLLASSALADANAEFDRLAARWLTELAERSPVSATLVGDHRADDRLDRVDAAARAANAAALQDILDALQEIDRDALSRDRQVDYELLASQLKYSLWSQQEFRDWAWNPLVYISTAGSGMYGLLARDFAPLDERLLNAAARMEQLPRFFAEMRASLQPAAVPKIHAETAAAQNAGLVSIIDALIVPQLGALSPADRERLQAAVRVARDALAENQRWLEEELLPQAAGDFRIGAALFDAKLQFLLDSPLDRREIRARAEREYEAVRNEMYAIAREVYAAEHPYTTFPDEPDEAYKQAIIRAALEKAYQELPPADGIVEVAREQLAQATAFVAERNLVTLPDDPVEIIIMPEFQRGISVAYLDAPGPLDEGQAAFYAVAPLPEDWTEAQIRSFLREYNLYSMQDLTIHEGTPGHALQLAFSNRYPSTLRAVLSSGPFVEGWAVYAERFMIDEGYLDHDPLMRLINRKWYLRAVTNAIIDSAIHVDGMSREEAMRLMIEGGFQEEREAAGKWVRAQLTSAQLSTYFVGYQEHADLRREMQAHWGDDFSLLRYHDTVLSFGSPPVRYVRALMLDLPIPAADD